MTCSRNENMDQRSTDEQIFAMVAGRLGGDKAIDLQGLAMRNTYQGSLAIGKRKADVRIESHQTIHFAMEQHVGDMNPTAAMRGNMNLPGNMRFALCHGSPFVLADTRLMERAKMAETLDVLCDGFRHAIRLAKNKNKNGDTMLFNAWRNDNGALLDLAAVEKVLAECAWPDDAVVAQGVASSFDAGADAGAEPDLAPDFIQGDTNLFQSDLSRGDNGDEPGTRGESQWELRLRLRGQTVPVQMVADAKSLGLSRTIVRSVSELHATCREALLHQAVCMNSHLRGARLALAGGRLIAECRLVGSQLRADSLTTAAYAVAVASRFSEDVLLLLAGQPDVASSYASMFCSSELGSGACASGEPCF